MNKSISEIDELLTWLQTELVEARLARDSARNSEIADFHNGRIDAMLNTIAFIQTEGKLR